MSELTRRSALRGSGVVIAGGVLGFAVTKASADTGDRGNDEANAYGAEPSGSSSAAIAAVSDVPVGGGVIRGNIVLTRPSGNDIHAFSAICTHQGCKVDKVANGKIDCPCHGSVFDASTGAVVGGPAPSPLGKIPIVVRNGKVYR